MTDYLQRLAMRGARAASDLPAVPMPAPAPQAVTPIAEISEQAPAEAKPLSPSIYAEPVALRTAPAMGIATPVAGEAPAAAQPTPPEVAATADMATGHELPPRQALKHAPQPQPLRAERRASPPASPPPPVAAGTAAVERRPRQTVLPPLAAAHELHATPSRDSLPQRADSMPVVARSAPLAAPVAPPRPSQATSRVATPVAPPAISVGTITIDLVPPAPAPRSAIERTRGFARYERLRRGLKS